MRENEYDFTLHEILAKQKENVDRIKNEAENCGINYAEFLHFFMKLCIDFIRLYQAKKVGRNEASSMQKSAIAPLAALDARFGGNLQHFVEEDLEGIMFEEPAQFAGLNEAEVSAAVFSFISGLNRQDYEKILRGAEDAHIGNNSGKRQV